MRERTEPMLLPKHAVNEPPRGTIPVRFDCDFHRGRRYVVWPLSEVFRLEPDFLEKVTPDQARFIRDGDGEINVYLEDPGPVYSHLMAQMRSKGGSIAFSRIENDLIEAGGDMRNRDPGFLRHEEFREVGWSAAVECRRQIMLGGRTPGQEMEDPEP